MSYGLGPITESYKNDPELRRQIEEMMAVEARRRYSGKPLDTIQTSAPSETISATPAINPVDRVRNAVTDTDYYRGLSPEAQKTVTGGMDAAEWLPPVAAARGGYELGRDIGQSDWVQAGIDAATTVPGLGKVASAAAPILPSAKRMMDLRRTYQGKGARTHPSEWDYKLGGAQPDLLSVKEFGPNEWKVGDEFVPYIGDRSRVSAPLVEVGGQKISPTAAEGGADYMRRPGDEGWASGGTVPAALHKKALAVQERGNRPLGVTVTMGPTALDYSHHSWEPLLKMVKSSNIPEAEKKAFDTSMRSEHPDWPGLKDEDAALSFLRANGPARMPFLTKVIDKDAQKAGFPEPGPVRWAMTEPELRDVPHYATGHNVVEIDPSRGPAPGSHSDYTQDLYKKGYLGRTPSLLPFTTFFRDWAAQPKIRDTAPSDTSRRMYHFRKDVPTQVVDQQLIDELGRLYEAEKRGR